MLFISFLNFLSFLSFIFSDCINEKSLPVNKQSLQFLESILSPIQLNDFISNYLQKKPMIAKRPEYPNYYGPMVDLGDIQYAIDNGRKFNLPDIEVVFGEDWKLAKRIYKNGEWWTGVFEHKEKITSSTAFYAVSQGYTLIFNRAQSVIPNVFQASWQLEEALGWLVNTNLYLTASGGAQGFEAHIDWMDGFIFQTAGTKRWKTYDPPLIVYPRPDMSKRPSHEFLTNRRNVSNNNHNDESSIPLNPPPNDFILRSGDLAYIPRGIVHEACTSKEDIPENISPNLEDLHPYEHPSTHLTFGLEVGKDYTVESLLHHYISTRFKFYKWGGITSELYDLLKLQSQSCSIFNEGSSTSKTCSQNTLNPEDIENIKTIRFSSDNKILYFDLILSSQDQNINNQNNIDGDDHGFETYNYLTGNQIYLQDFFHLLLSYIASDTTDDRNWNEHNVFTKKFDEDDSQEHLYSNNTYLLRQAVGINKFTSTIAELNPRTLFSLGVEVVIDRINKIDLNGFFNYLLNHRMFSITAYQILKNKQTKESSLLNLLWKTISPSFNSYISSSSSFNSLQFYESLSSLSDNEEYITLGSDKQLSYINKYLSSNFLTNNERVFNLAILLTEETENEINNVNQFNLYNWNNFKDKNDKFNKVNFNTYLNSINWNETKETLQKMIYQLFSINDPQQGERNLCSAYARMINTIKEDKQKRKRNGLSALRNAGHNI